MATGVVVWSKTAASNATADSAQNWAEGMAPSAVNDSARAGMASVAMWRDDNNGSLVTGGGTTVYTLTTNQTFAALTAGYSVAFQMNATNTGTSTLNVDSLGAKPLRKAAGVEVIAGDLVIGRVYRASYFTSNSGEWLLHDGPTALADGQVATAKIADDAVTYAKLQNVSATSRILGRKTASAGDPEECTLSEVLDFIGSAAQGDILYRGASGWAQLGAGTSGQLLKTNGTGANPAWFTSPITAAYTSSDQTISLSNTGTLAHGLGAEPKIVQLFLVCQSGEGGYSAGDVATYAAGPLETGGGFGITVDSTNITFRTGQNAPYLINKSTGQHFNIALASWKLRIKAFA